jgi:hypothetical protein
VTIPLIREFRLSPPAAGHGVSCDAGGAFIESVPLLKRTRIGDQDAWAPRDACDISTELGAAYGLPIDVASKAKGFDAIARALNAGNIAHAQLVALHLKFPQAPELSKRATPQDDAVRFIWELHESGLLEKIWLEAEHPRWPAKAPDGKGGEFAPKGDGTEGQRIEVADRTGESGGRHRQTASTKPQHLRPWQDLASEMHEKPTLAIANWILPQTAELDETEIIEQLGAKLGLKPGAYADESIPASGSRINTAEQAEIDRIGAKSGCHTCGTRNPGTRRGHWIGDHQPPGGLNASGNAQRLYPHCVSCSSRQGGYVSWILRYFSSNSR